MKLNVRVVAAAAAVLGVAALVLPASVGAQKVQNPGTFALQATGGQMVIGGLSLDLTPRPLPECSDGIDNNANTLVDTADGGCSAGPNGEPASSDDSELAWGFQPKINVSITGTIDGAGNISIPTSGVVFPPAYVAININGVWVVKAEVLATAPATGTLDPLTGAAVLNVKARIKLSGNIGNQLASTCSIGTVASPVSLNLVTGRKEAVPPNGAITGAPYNSTTGTALLVDNAFSVPGATGCTAGIFTVNDAINQQVGIPSAAGRNAAVVAGKTAPVLAKAINPVITSSVPLAGNEAPFDVTFSGASSTLAKGPAAYSWEFSDGTTATGEYVDKTFNAGNQSAKLTVTDADGDKNSVTSNFVVAPGTGSTTTTTTTSTTTTTTPTTTTTTTPTTTTTTTTPTTTTTTTTTTPTTTTTTTTPTTTTTTTPTTTTTSTTIPQPSDDSVQVRVNGAVNYVNGGTGNGDLAVQRDSSGIRSVTGLLDIPGTQGGAARASVSIQRAWILPLWTGQVSVRDQTAGVNVSAPVFGQISAGSTAKSAKGTSNWFIAGTFPNLFRPYSFSWEVIDAD